MSKPDESTITAIHEAAHAIFALSLGHIPDRVVSGTGTGSVDFTSAAMSNDDRMQIGLAGDAAVEQLLGVTGTGSMSDDDLALPGYQDVVASGIGWQQRQSLALFMSRRVAELEGPIVALANVLLQRGELSRDDLGDVCRHTAGLAQFAVLFPAASPRAFHTGRPQARRSRGPGELPPGFKFTARR